MSVHTFSVDDEGFTYTSDDERKALSPEQDVLEKELKLARDLMAEADRIMRSGSRLMEYGMSLDARASHKYAVKAKKRVNLGL
jgi:hypothetical protein